METFLFIGKSTEITTWKREGNDWHLQNLSLFEKEVTSLSAGQGKVLAGTRDGILSSNDLGRSWTVSSEGLGIRYVRWLANHPESTSLVFAGTEPAGIYISNDNGNAWTECPEVIELRERGRWSLPYSPAAGCVRGFAFRVQEIYAAAEVGGVLRSGDSGKHWEMANGKKDDWQERVNADVHSIEVHPISPDLLYAATGGGLYLSRDRGQRWEQRYNCYCRAVWVDPEDSEHMVLGPAENVDRGGRIEESKDGGRTWQAANTSLDTPWPRHMVERFYLLEDILLALLSNGELLVAAPNDLSWRRLSPDLQDVRALAWLKV